MPDVESDSPFGDPAALPHDSLKADVIACAVGTFVTAAAFVSLRFYTRTKIVRALAASDWFLLASLIGSGLQSASFIRQSVHGLGSHVWDFDVESNIVPLLQSSWFCILWYNVTLMLIKISFLLLYIRIFQYQRTGTACKVILGIVVAAGIYGLVITVTSCIPIQAAWDSSITDAYCRGAVWFWVNTALHVVTDFMIWSVPIPRIWRMSLPRMQKVTLVGLFSLGFVVAFISFVRVIYLDKVHRSADPDFTWVGAWFGFLSMIEVNAAIVVACLITLKPLSHRLWPNLLRDHSLEQLDGENPPTIGSRPPLRHDDRRRDGSGKDSEAWEMSNTESQIDIHVSTTASSSHEARV